MTLNKKSIAALVMLALVLIICVFISTKKISPISMKLWGEINQEADVALAGNDAVAYHTQGAALMGSSDYEVKWNDVTWQFSSTENKALFVSNPEKYAPQFGGYCSFAVSQGVTADVSHDVWLLKEGKLYLFMDAGVKKEWIANNGLIASNQNWGI